MPEIKQVDCDNLADIIWWIKGYIAGAKENFESCPFGEYHINSLIRAKEVLAGEIKEDKEKIK